MKLLHHIIFGAACFLLLQSCTGTRRFGTTIERDENNPCRINIIIQIGIQGTDADVEAVKKDLDACYGKECFIPCENNKEKGCITKVTTVVKKWSSLKDEEQIGFHYVEMVNNDGLPSTAYYGIPNRATPELSCRWRRDAFPGTYCHEVLHLCGLEDKYCARIYDPSKDSVITERNCVPPPDPGGNCCTPGVFQTRCTVPCAGHEHDMMGASGVPLTCDNIRDVLKVAGMNSCPPECCNSDQTFTKPPDEVYIMPGYFHFGDKNTKFGSFGGSLGYTKQLGSSLGITIEGGYYSHTEEESGIKQTSGLFHITGGVTYRLSKPSAKGISISTHALIGISRYTQKFTYSGNSESDGTTSLHFNIGAALDLRLNRSWSLRLLQANYAPTFFYDATQHNYRISAGVVHHLGRK